MKDIATALAKLLADLLGSPTVAPFEVLVDLVRQVPEALEPGDQAILTDLRELGVPAAPAVYDRRTVEELQAHHDSMQLRAVAAAEAGKFGLALSFKFMHDLVCPYLAIRRGDTFEDSTAADDLIVASLAIPRDRTLPSQANPQDN